MPVVPPNTPLTPTYGTTPLANQVLPQLGNLPYVQQMTFGQIIGAVSDRNPDRDISSIQQDINMEVRKIYDRRIWYGLLTRGQIATVGQVIGGTVMVQNGINLAQGTGTSWDYSLVGRQFRTSYNVPPSTITAVDPTNQVLALDMPWASPTQLSASYFIQQIYYPVGPNIKYIHTAKNLIMAWRMQLGFNQQSLDAIDPWRIATFSPSCLVQMPADPKGNYQVELYPAPAIVQPLPFVAAVQPPNLVDDTDSLPPYIRTDILAKLSIANTLVYRGPKQNQYYDAVESQRLRGEAEAELQVMALADENLYRQDFRLKWEDVRMAPVPGSGGAYYAVNHGVEAGESMWGDIW